MADWVGEFSDLQEDPPPSAPPPIYKGERVGEFSDLQEDPPLSAPSPIYKGERFGVLTKLDNVGSTPATPDIREEPMLPRREP